MKIALFGGSFDPPHLGHDTIVKEALKSLDIDRLIIMPTFISPFKAGFRAQASLRLAWARLLWGKLPRVLISDFEIAQNRPVPSIESVLHLERLYKPSKFYLIIGADHLARLSSWHRFDELAQKVEFIIAKRADIAVPKEFKSLETHIDIASSLIRDRLDLACVDKRIKAEVKKTYAKVL